MKRHIRMILAIGLALLCIIALPQDVRAESWVDKLFNVPVFKFTNHEKGIGCGACPVYTAPYENAYRVNGNAACATNSEMSECGFINGWLFVRYETNNGGYRVGYIPPKYTRGKKITSHTPKFHNVEAKADGEILVTDNPMLLGSRFAKLKKGDSFTVLAKYTYFGDWWYIECTVDGKIARGFIDRASSKFSKPGNPRITPPPTYRPELSVWNTPYKGDVKIKGGSGDSRKIVRAQPSAKAKQVCVVYPGKKYPCYATKSGWYGIYIEEDNVWGWIASGLATMQR